MHCQSNRKEEPMTYHYVEDYEAVTGRKPEPDEPDAVEAKVVEAPQKAPAKKTAAKVTTKTKG